MKIHQPCWLDIMQWGHANAPAIFVRHNDPIALCLTNMAGEFA